MNPVLQVLLGLAALWFSFCAGFALLGLAARRTRH